MRVSIADDIMNGIAAGLVVVMIAGTVVFCSQLEPRKTCEELGGKKVITGFGKRVGSGEYMKPIYKCEFKRADK